MSFDWSREVSKLIARDLVVGGRLPRAVGCRPSNCHFEVNTTPQQASRLTQRPTKALQTRQFLSRPHRQTIYKMATAFEPSRSSSIGYGRQSMAPVAPSAADSLPSINFGFDDLRDRMAKFTAKFDAFIEQGRKRVLEERNQFRMNVAELQGTAT